RQRRRRRSWHIHWLTRAVSDCRDRGIASKESLVSARSCPNTYKRECGRIEMVVKEPRKAAPRPRRGRTETQTELAAIKREIEVSQEEADSRTDELIRLREDSIRQAVKD